MKQNDKVYCIKNYTVTFVKLRKEIKLCKGQYYPILNIFKGCVNVNGKTFNIGGKRVYEYEPLFCDYFLTEKQMRKEKLNKLNGKNNLCKNT